VIIRYNQQKYHLPILLGASLIFFLYGLGSFALIGPDEPRYAQVAREMLARGDFITPTIGGHPWFEKPVLLYWLMAASMRWLGVTEFAARWPSAVVAMLAAFVIYYAGRRIISPRFGFLSALTLIVSVMFASFAHGATTDMPLAAMLSVGLCCFLLFDTQVAQVDNLRHLPPDERWQKWFILASYACWGLAVLAKGLVGIVLPAGIVGLYLLVTHQFGKLRKMQLLLGVGLFLLVVSVWSVPVTIKHGWTFINEFFISHHFQRFTTGKFHHPGPIYYFVPVILVGIFPWTAFLISALSRLRWSQRQSAEPLDRVRWFCALWILVPLIFFSLSQSKLPGYILPVMPAATLLVGSELDHLIGRGMDRALKLAAFMTPVLILSIGCGGIAYARKEAGSSGTGEVLVLITTVLTGLTALFFIIRRAFKSALVSLVIGCALGIILVNHIYLPTIERRESLRPLAQAALQKMKPGEKILGYYYFDHTLTFYTNARSFYDERGNVIIATSPEELIRKVHDGGSVLCVTKAIALPDLKTDRRLHVKLLGEQGDIVLLRVSDSGSMQPPFNPQSAIRNPQSPKGRRPSPRHPPALSPR
jgi:4-amino-4-deoxy-L-arabinose transferase-like glycosyltransferase